MCMWFVYVRPNDSVHVCWSVQKHISSIIAGCVKIIRVLCTHRDSEGWIYYSQIIIFITLSICHIDAWFPRRLYARC